MNGIETSNGNGLSIWEFAEYFGINPMHFAGAMAPSTTPMVMPDRGCNSLWQKYAWQDSDSVSLTELGQTIRAAEDAIERHLGRHVAPKWALDTIRDAAGAVNGAGDHLEVFLRMADPIAYGYERRTFLAQAATNYIDRDGDGFAEVCEVVFPIGSVTQADKKNLEIFFPDKGGDKTYKIYPLEGMIIDETAGTITVSVMTWKCVIPELRERFPVAGEEPFGAVDISNPANLVPALDLYLYFVGAYDEAHPAATITLEKACSSFASDCGQEEIPAIVETISARVGHVRVCPAEAVYDETTGAFTGWRKVRRSGRVIRVDIAYLSGMTSSLYDAGVAQSPLESSVKRAIAVLAAARLRRPFKTCSNLAEYIEDLQADLTLRTQSGARYVDMQDVLACPFGTRAGEVDAWRVVKYVIKARRAFPALV